MWFLVVRFETNLTVNKTVSMGPTNSYNSAIDALSKFNGCSIA